jgi:hypothetical protein
MSRTEDDKSEDEYVESRELERRRVCRVSPFESEDENIEYRDESEDEYVESRDYLVERR